MTALSTDPQFVAACIDEDLNPDDAAAAIATGRLVFLRCSASRSMPGFAPLLVGADTRRKIAALIGLGPNNTDREAIVRTMKVVLAARPDAIMDLTTNTAGVALRADLKEVVGVPLGACLTYDLFTAPRKRFSRTEFLTRFEMGLAAGVDFVLVHMGITPDLVERMEKSSRVMPTTSRGGGLVARYMKMHNVENPFIEYLDGIVEICRRREVVLDLGDVFRPGCAADAGDELKRLEIQLLAEVRKEILAGGVQVLAESGGHIPLHRIPELIPAYKEALGGAPLWLAGPMVIDNGVTLDDVVNTLGIVTAGACGGDMFASITHNEHYAMPTAPDTAVSVRMARVAITALEVVRGSRAEVARQRAISVARRANDWDAQSGHALYPDLANQVFIQHDLKRGAPCTICGKYCPHIITRKENTETSHLATQLPIPRKLGE
ncbi:hypothetical protein GZH49_30235 [Nocardia terpenica]|uniref:phosphomethylpyrimidine synthase ThiC n=1 Tax=Nocardia terpenica TaxID=455432 RepID=UPI002FE384A0